MPSLDNANPTIHTTSSNDTSSSRRSVNKPLTPRSLWAEEGLHLSPSAFSSGRGRSLDGSPVDDETEADEEEDIDEDEIYDLLRSITDPEHPLTLEQLAVVSSSQITLSKNHVLVEFTPTIPHCSMATLIGLSLRVRLLRSLPERYKVDIRVKEGTHQSEHAVNKQLNDKERVAAALENSHLLGVVEGCLATAGRRGGEVISV